MNRARSTAMANRYRTTRTAALLLACWALVACGRGGNDEQAAAEPPAPTSATIISVDPIKETVEKPREVCEDVAVTTQAPVKDQHQVAGTAAGAVVGGVLGNQVGSGRGKSVATAAGAVIGGYVGNKVQGNVQAGKTQTTMERQCTTVVDKSTRVTGYLVKYDLGGKSGSVRMDQPPKGTTIPVLNGQLVLHSVSIEQ